MIELECPICGTEFDAMEWYDGECPNCGNTYGWDEMCNEDYSDCYSFADWDYHPRGSLRLNRAREES
jgi:hypothetical protein